MIRNRWLVAVGALVALGVITSDLSAQEREGRRGRGMRRAPAGLMLLGQKSVQEDLKLSEDQVSAANKAIEAQRTAMQNIFSSGESDRAGLFEKARADADKAVEGILNEDQKKRLKQIGLQVQGASALRNEEVMKELNITDDQRQQITKIEQELMSEARSAFEGGTDREARRKKMEELRASAKQKAEALLTDEQKKKWADLKGAEFTGEIELRRGFGGRGEGRRRNAQ